MRNISFQHTQPQLLNRTKTVTRRTGWGFLEPGQLQQAVEKVRGLKRGERLKKLCVIRVTAVREEPLSRMLDESYGSEEVVREGFGEMSPQEFVEMFCRTHHCTVETIVTRIEFTYE